MFELQGKKVVIIGGSAGMGLATAEAAIDLGAEVVIAARNEENLRRASEALSARGKRPVPWQSLSIEDRPAVAAFMRAHAPFDHLVMPGSTVKPLLYDELTDESAREAFESKFWGPFWAAYDARPLLRRGGSIVFFSGVAAERTVKGYIMGGSINGALNALVRSLALEFGPLGIRCNVIAASVIDTPLLDNLHAHDKDEIIEALSRRLPVGRVGTAEETGSAAVFLMTNGFVDGEIITVDGGHRAVP